jgi:hypothetical protein
MELKYTLEILTKDIQDIEKLVGNLQNSPEGSTLELDLALSKLRNVYDILTSIRTEMNRPGKVRPGVSAPPERETPSSEASEKPVAAPDHEVDQEDPAGTEGETTAAPPPKSTGILAEKFSAGSSINENLGGNREAERDSKLVGPPIDSISRNIGINDRFLIIRELFDGDTERFGKLIRDLDQAGDFNSACRMLEEVFDPSQDHEGISILNNLVKRRYNGK